MLRSYERGWLRADLVAGLRLAAYLLPAGIGDASLAGLPPQAGIYACLFSGWSSGSSAVLDTRQLPLRLPSHFWSDPRLAPLPAAMRHVSVHLPEAQLCSSPC
ncbi:MAG: SulP family inorganic anion transporter [Pyrinomonadaceae bacterium]